PAPLRPRNIAENGQRNVNDGNGRIQEGEWVNGAGVENLEIKRKLLEAVDSARKPGSLVTTNTSGLSVTALAQNRSDDFRQRWFGTHFFNPPRYMKLLEVIPTAETDPNTLADFDRFAATI